MISSVTTPWSRICVIHGMRAGRPDSTSFSVAIVVWIDWRRESVHLLWEKVRLRESEVKARREMPVLYGRALTGDGVCDVNAPSPTALDEPVPVPERIRYVHNYRRQNEPRLNNSANGLSPVENKPLAAAESGRIELGGLPNFLEAKIRPTKEQPIFRRK